MPFEKKKEGFKKIRLRYGFLENVTILTVTLVPPSPLQSTVRPDEGP